MALFLSGRRFGFAHSQIVLFLLICQTFGPQLNLLQTHSAAFRHAKQANPLLEPNSGLFPRKKRGVLGAFHQRRPFTSTRPSASFCFVAEIVPFLFVPPASPSAPSCSPNERANLSDALSGLLPPLTPPFAVAVVRESPSVFHYGYFAGRRAQRIMGLGAVGTV